MTMTNPMTEMHFMGTWWRMWVRLASYRAVFKNNSRASMTLGV